MPNHPQYSETHEHTHSKQSVQWMKCRRRFKMQALTICDAKFMSTRTADGQFKGQFKGALDEMSQKGSKGKHSAPHRHLLL